MIEIIPVDVRKIALVIMLTFLIGLVQEERKHEGRPHYVFGGVRTYPFFGILGYVSALLGLSHPAILAVGFAAIASFMLLSYHHKSVLFPGSGITSETSGLLTFLLGAVVHQEFYWIATTLVVAAVLLLELKGVLEGLAEKIPSAEIMTFTKFLVLAAVILPILPSEPLTQFHINPQRVWLIVCAVSGISYASYILQLFIGSKGILVSAILGGAYSSTATTIALSKRSAEQKQSRLYSGAIVVSSGVMYLRLAILIGILNQDLGLQLAPILVGLGLVAVIFGTLFSRTQTTKAAEVKTEAVTRNPLEIRSAVVFAGLFLAMLVITPLVVSYLGDVGVYVLSVVTGITDVDPFILGLTQTAGHTTTIMTASIGILIATSSNNIAKGVYTVIFGDQATGQLSLIFLSALAVLGVLPLFYFLTA